jgi:hypothetical protein
MTSSLKSFCLPLAVAMACVSNAAAADPSAKLSPADGAFFENQVRPILVAKCYECHSQDSKILQGGLLLDSKPGWLKGGDSGQVIVPGKPDESLLVRAVRYAKDEHVQMPPKGKMTDAEIDVLVQWVRRGAPDPRTTAAVATKRVIDVEAGKKHWAFAPLRKAAPLTFESDRWSRTPVDRYIRLELDRAKLTPNDLAERRVLIRRAYFDLLGLPPKPEEVDAFVADKSPDAYEKLLERLLASPHYGERWGRHWLDLARFAESHGFEQDYDRPNAYHYRDFVIKALNQDLPYDKFVKWQIAGDEYEPDNPLALAATGFLAAGVHATQITANQAEKERYDELDDMARTIGTTMLGITIGCARCHDHKFDPLTQADYYRLTSTFTTTVRSDYDVNLDAAGYRKALAEFEPTHKPLVDALAKYEREKIVPKFDTWLADRTASGKEPTWILAKPTATTAPAPIKFTTLEDGSVRVRGSQFFAAKYAVTLETALTDIRSIRLEAIADDGLPGGGPGMGPKGDVKIVKLSIQAVPKGKGSPVEAVIVSRTVDAQSTVTANPQSWEISGEGRNAAAVFALKDAIGFAEGTKLNITIELAGNNQGLGRFRFALATGAGPHAPAASEISESARTVLKKFTAEKSAKPTPAERETLLGWFRTQDAEWLKLHGVVQANEAKRPKPQVAKMLISSEGVPAVRLHTQGPDFYVKTYVVRRGDPNQKVEEAKPGFVGVLVRSGDDARWRAKPPAGATTSYRRRGLAEWITDVDAGAGHLLARVIVNRLWYYHFGAGLNPNPSDFGVQSPRPPHAELIDFLANELIRNEWRLKPIHKLIMTSAVYMQTSKSDPARVKADPENRLFWHKPLRRLEGEIVRDAMMACAGTLDEKMFGPGTLAADQPRRSIYYFVKRTKLMPMMTLFDGPDTLQDLAVRPETTVAPQALMLMNNGVLRKYAEALAKKIIPASPGGIEQGIDLGYRSTIGRSPSADELRDSKEFVAAQIAAYRAEGKGAAAESLAWGDFCQVLFGLNEFVYVE